MDTTSFDIRPVTPGDADLGPAVAIMAALDRGPESICGYQSLRTRMRQIVHVAAWADDEPIGFGFAGTWPGDEDGPLLEALLGVMPTHRRRGLGSALFRALSESARELGKTAFQFEVWEDRADALDFLLHRGYTEVGRELQFELDLLAATLPRSEPPEGLEIVTRAQRPELTRGMYEVVLDTVADIPGNDGEAVGRYEDWYAFEIGSPNNLPHLCFIAVHEEEVIGFATLQVFDGDTAHHGATLVKQAWRRRGIARALTLRQILAAKAAGFEHLHCETEVRNQPMRRLLEQLGYRSLSRVIELRGPLADPGGEHKRH